MNPGIIEETGQTARSFFDALKGQPAVLALAVANICILGLFIYALEKAATFRDKMLTEQLAYQRHVSELLARCIVPEHRSSGEPPATFGDN